VAESLRNPDARAAHRRAAREDAVRGGEEQVKTFDAQALAEEFIGDALAPTSSPWAMHGSSACVPLSFEALMRAIELNGVAVAANRLAFAAGPAWHAADPEWARALMGDRAASSTMDLRTQSTSRSLRRARRAHLTDYQDAAMRGASRPCAAWRPQKRAVALGGDASLPFSAVARSLLKLMSYKDEYEVARLYMRRQLPAQPAWNSSRARRSSSSSTWPRRSSSRRRNGRRRARSASVPGCCPRCACSRARKALRGTPFDPFGRTQERRLERELIAHFEARLDELAQDMAAADQKLLADIAALPMTIRGYGHVKIGNLALARAREAELLHRLRPQRYPAPASTKAAGQIKGIAIVAAH
jgi:indolepyruvate ferredoxin oxidoreductase